MSDFNRAGKLPRPVAVPHVFRIQHLSGGLVRDDGRGNQLHQRRSMHHLVELLYMPCMAMRRTAAADVPIVRDVSTVTMRYMAGITLLSGRCIVYSDVCADGQLRRDSDMRRDYLRPDNSGQSVMRRRGIVCAESVVQCLWYMPRLRDLRSCGDMRSQHVSELQHVRGIRLL